MKKYVVYFSKGFGQSFEKKYSTKAAAIKAAKKLDKHDAYASEVFEIVLKPVEERIAKFGNVM